MVKKVSPFSSIKRAACICCFSADNKQQSHDDDKTSKENKKKKKKKSSNGHKSFIPIFNEPSSIEKILEDAERHSLLPPPPSSQQLAPPSPKSPPLPKATAAAAASSSSRIVDEQAPPKVVSSSLTMIQADSRARGGSLDDQVSPKLLVSPSVVTPNRGYADDHVPPKVFVSSVTKIQAAYRGFVARRGYKALKGLVRLQGVTNSESVKRQIMNAMKTMQSFSKLQTEIRLLRIQVLESKALQRKTQLINNNNNNNNESVQVPTTSSSKQPAQSNDWDDSMLSMHERESRLQKKQEAILLKEKAMSYAAYTQQKQQHLNSHLPWWWNWIDHKLPLVLTNNTCDPPPLLKSDPTRVIPARYYYPRSRPSSSSAGAHKFAPFPFNDDSNSLVSCPAFTSPHSQRHYMEQTASTKAKIRPKSNPRQRMIPGRSQSPGAESSRRFSFPTTPISGSSKFKTESFEQQGVSALHQKVDQLSMGSPTSVNSRNIRKPFNRFV